MATNLRLLIGATIIDSVEGVASTSTIPGAVFSFPLEGVIGRTTETSEEIPIRIRCNIGSGDTPSDLADLVEDVLDALEAMATEGVIIEAGAGETIMEIDPAEVAGLSFTVEKHWGDKGCTLLVTIAATRIDASGIGTGEWQIQRNTAGGMKVVGKLTFANMTAAVTAVAAMRSGSVRPTWMPTSARVIEDTLEAGQRQGSIATLVGADYRPVTHTVIWETLANHMATSSAFADVKRAEWKGEVKQRDPLNIRAGNGPGFNVNIRGLLEFKTEQHTVYDSLDAAAVAASALLAKAIACAQVILQEAQARLGTTIQLLEELNRGVTGSDGVYEIDLVGVTGGPTRVLTWNETETFEENFQGEFVGCTDGSEWEGEDPRGDEQLITHTLEIVSLGRSARGYLRPQGLPGSGWRRINRADEQPQRSRIGEAHATRVVYNRKYRRVPTGNGGGGGNPDRRTSSGGTAQGNSAWVSDGDPNSPTGHVGMFG
jgi:hypothetical protein